MHSRTLSTLNLRLISIWGIRSACPPSTLMKEKTESLLFLIWNKIYSSNWIALTVNKSHWHFKLNRSRQISKCMLSIEFAKDNRAKV